LTILGHQNAPFYYKNPKIRDPATPPPQQNSSKFSRASETSKIHLFFKTWRKRKNDSEKRRGPII